VPQPVTGEGTKLMKMEGTGEVFLAHLAEDIHLIKLENGSSNLATHVKADVNMKSLVGKGSGESLQIGFAGVGWVLVQPSEARVASAPSNGGGGGGGLLGSLGG
jgi:uncharacterized protein (AIM24 family)